MLTARYLASVKNLSAIMQKIVQGTAPEKFTVEHLKSLGFASSNDRAVIPLLKDLGFLSADGTPTQRYSDYRDGSRSRLVMADAVKDAYGDVFHVAEKPTDADRAAIQGKFKSALNSSDRIAEMQSMTFLALLKLADLSASRTTMEQRSAGGTTHSVPPQERERQSGKDHPRETRGLELRYNIEIHLPASKDAEVFNAIFKALKENLLG